MSARLRHRGKGIGTVDVSMATEMGEKSLKRIVAVIMFLGERGGFHLEDIVLGSSHNGNFLGILELISQFDPFLAWHCLKSLLIIII